jgi:hypothetical protein
MRTLIQWRAPEVRQSRDRVLERLGILSDEVSDRLDRLLDRAQGLFDECAKPGAVFQSVSRDEFAEIYAGDGMNEPATPLGEILPRAESLATFAATLGRRIDEEIRQLFDGGDPALGYLLDVIAGLAAEQLAELTAERFLRVIRCRPEVRALPYSPGYCGWHVSGQRALFEHVRPVELGIGLTESCLMDPVKSVSGVLVAGPADIHKFIPAYGFCSTCETKTCRARIAAVLGRTR